jgi:hypothetical protein
MNDPTLLAIPGVVLATILSFSGVSVIDKKCPPNLLGEYEPKTDTVYMCPDNIKESKYGYEEVLSHELVHALQERVGGELIPEPFLTDLVRWTMEDPETMAILLNYEGDTHAEFEARVLQRLPSWLISFLLVLN